MVDEGARDGSDTALQAGGRVLIVDDDPPVARMLASGFQRLGFEAHTAFDRAGALETLAKVQPALVVLDLYLGRSSGLELLSVMKEHAPEVDIVLMSGYASIQVTVDAMRRGARTVQSKPLTAASILEELRRAKGASEVSAPLEADAPRSVTLVEALERKNAELMELHRFKDEMTTFIVHDLKNPVTVLTANLQYVSSESWVKDTPHVSEAISSSQTATRRILGLATNILDLIRLESSAMTLCRSVLPLEPFFAELLSCRDALRSERNIEAKLSVEPADLAAEWDVGLITRMVENILDNAMRYAGPSGRIEIVVRRVDENVTMRIGNTGPPIPRELRPLMFEKFRQAPDVRTATNFGLGLYFCRLAIEAHGGSISVLETDDFPTVFAITIPVS